MCLRSQKKLSRALVETRITYEGPMDGIFSLHVQGFTFLVFSSHKEKKKNQVWGERWRGAQATTEPSRAAVGGVQQKVQRIF